ncbi:MAG: tetratricopeptide repeat protein [Planctomycetes bacterium]|nr:tetratricopeptide repeat protein [Planctomycetota bacterium]
MRPKITVLIAFLLLLALANFAAAQDLERAKALTAQGNSYMAAGDLPKAIELYSAAAEAHPRYLSSFFMRSRAYLQLDLFEQAREDLGYVLEIFGGSTQIGGGSRAQAVSQVLAMRALVGLALSDYAAALADARRALEEWDANPPAILALAYACHTHGQDDEAERTFRRLLPHDPATLPESSAGEIRAGIALSLVARGNVEAALSAVDEAKKDPAASGAAGAIEAIVRSASGRTGDLDRALALVDGDLSGAGNLRFLAEGLAFHAAGRHREALAALAQFPRTPFHPAAVLARGLSAAALGLAEDAAKDLAPLAGVLPRAKEAIAKLGDSSAVGHAIERRERDQGGASASDRASFALQEETFTLLSHEIRTSVRRYRFAQASADATRLAAGLSRPSLKEEAERMEASCKRYADLLGRMVAALAEGKASSREIELTPGVSGRPVSADSIEIKIEFEGGSAAVPWASLPFERFVEIARALEPAPEEWMALAELAFDHGRPSLGERYFVSAIQADAGSRAEASRRFAALSGTPEPAGGFEVHQGALVTPEAKKSLSKGLVLYEGQWVSRADKDHLEKGHQKIDGKWVPLTAKQLEARGYRRLEGKWLSSEEYARARGEWSAAWTKESPHYRVKTNQSEAFCGTLSELLEAAHAEYERFFGARPNGAPKMTMYAFSNYEDYKAYCDSLPGGGAPGAGGFAPSEPHTGCGWAKYGNEQYFLETIVHEAAHLYFFETRSVPPALPSWVHEGMATYFEGFRRDGGKWVWDHISRKRLSLLQWARGQNGLIPLPEFFVADAANLIDTDGAKAGVFYSQAWALYYFLQQTANPRYQSGWKSYWDKVTRGSPADLLQELGVDAPTLAGELDKYVQNL